MTQLTPEQRAAAEELARRNARRSLSHFAQAVRPKVIPGEFFLYLCAHLEAVLRGEIRRLMIFAPPQSGKSWASSEIFPAFWLAHRPDAPMILSSYNDDMAREKAGYVREIVSSSEYQSLFSHIKLKADSRAKSSWQIEDHQGGMKAAGAGGSLTGRPGGMAIIDDPIANWEAAQSIVIRERVWRWYDTVFRTRLWEDAPVILIQTRWHEDDLAGRILNSPDAPNWTVLRLPALAETQEERDDANKRIGLPLGLPDPLGRQPDEALAPYRYSAEYLKEVRRTSLLFTWQALYQGSPRPLEGNDVKRSMLQLVDAAPVAVQRRIRYWDIAATHGGGARTAGVLVALGADGLFYIEDVVYGQWATRERNQVMLQISAFDAIRYVRQEEGVSDFTLLPGYNSVQIYIEREPGSSGEDAFLAFADLLKGYPVFEDRATGAKDVRFLVVSSAAARGSVHLVRGQWNEAYIDEIVTVPNGPYRDMADATAGALALLERPSGLQLGMA